MEVTADGALYASITLPAVLCATVGGGTGLPSQAAAMSLLRVKDARQLAEVCAAACLAGELSITGANLYFGNSRVCADSAVRGQDSGRNIETLDMRYQVIITDLIDQAPSRRRSLRRHTTT
jgi:hydroxymethylglutaryl-CoA reductase